MQHTSPHFKVSLRRPEFTFILITLDAGVNKVVIVFPTTNGSWLKMVNGEFSTSVSLRDTTVATTILIAFSNGWFLRSRHRSKQ
jgi:hypothetical protein